MKQIVRAFALGILTATVLLGVIYFFDNDNDDVVGEQNTAENNVMDLEEMIEELEMNGYYVSTEEPTDEQDLTETETQKESTENESENESGSDTDTETTAPETFNLTIESGMTISQVAESLENANIIEDREVFITYLNDNDYGTNIQIGEFELNSEMTLQEIADTIANQN
ncbi:hypothetical protein GCM10011351_17110 [Paraliobacillus quinghaiensis]|uniref:YceG-like family protein n=1 Tax=Paraliobacillus quinghaiensis TaxID=470815 RepID=A0A917TRG4_9BACI|nr:endolytic transglycosylase MltG [Paraliobacillus quinghaiensis]GGM31525.1 hypothetical protein GCM10011351_17110 [Paraliobacillus quinghaiensis]